MRICAIQVPKKSSLRVTSVFQPLSSTRHIASSNDAQQGAVNGAGGSLTLGSRFKSAFAYQSGNSNGAVNGTVGTAATAGNIPSVTQVNLGNDAQDLNSFQGYLQRVRFYPGRLSDSSIQQLTQ